MFDLKTEQEMRDCQRERGGRKRTEKEGISTENPAAFQEAAQRQVYTCVHTFVYQVWTWIFWNLLEPETQGLHETVRNLLLVGKAGLKAWSREEAEIHQRCYSKPLKIDCDDYSLRNSVTKDAKSQLWNEEWAQGCHLIPRAGPGPRFCPQVLQAKAFFIPTCEILFVFDLLETLKKNSHQ